MSNKNSLDINDWVSIFFWGVVLILGFTFLKEKIVTKPIILSDDKKNNIKIVPLRGFVPNQEDESVKMFFATPYGMVEDKETAKQNGVYKIYRSADAEIVHPESAICVSFVKKRIILGIYGIFFQII